MEIAMKVVHEVLWDGRRDGPGGRQLFTEEEHRVEHPEPTRRRATESDVRDAREAVLAQLERQAQTMRELAASTGLTTERINGALYALRHVGRVRIVGEKPRSGRCFGRIIEAIYGITR